MFNFYRINNISSFSNNTFLVQVTPRFENSVPEIQGGGFDQTYRFVQYHFHWGLHDNEGSEHTLAGLHYPAELHLVHEGLTNPNKIAVVGVFFVLGDDDKALHQECTVLNKIIDPSLFLNIIIDNEFRADFLDIIYTNKYVNATCYFAKSSSNSPPIFFKF
ncbi:unnamed protein product [Onchocerca flexuosa]|uniref:Carbonic anhydrase n=1 Tax=Onchocerca flexuosa TaxID=387005 RepID=A0A183HPG8_9BILA|nr:unnamed protein product [Onchocerca flexuosa]